MSENNNIKSIYSLSPMQSMMLFNSIKGERKEDPYFSQYSFMLKGQLDFLTLKKAFQFLIDRHEVFKTVFLFEKVRDIVQVVLKDKKCDISYEDISLAKNKDRIIEKYKEEDINKGFNLSKDSLIRMKIFKLNEELFKVILSTHHIVIDGWCMNIILYEIMEIYEAIKDERNAILSKVNPYGKYIAWMKKQNPEVAKEYWENYLESWNKVSKIISETKLASNYERSELSFEFSKETTNSLRILSREYSVTISTLVHFIWALLLQSYSNSDEVIFGTVVSGRQAPIEGIENSVGMFINTIPVKVSLNESSKLNKILSKLQEDILKGEKYSYISLIDMLDSTLNKQETINHIIAIENLQSGEEIKNKYLSLENINTKEQASYDLNILIFPSDTLKVKFSYNRNVYSDKIINLIMNHFKYIGEELILKKDKILTHLDFKNRFLNEINTLEENQALYEFLSYDFINFKRKEFDKEFRFFS